MSITEAGPLTDLEFLRTVDRRMLHRSALSEVFLTSASAVDEHRFVAGAQLPPAHAYYTDHLTHDRTPDPLLLLECCRQAETYGAHAFHQVPRDAKFVLRSWSWEQHDSAVAPPAGPAELTMDVTTANPQLRDGELRGLEYRMELSLGGAPLGVVRMAASYLPARLYQPLRTGGRGSLPPLSDSPRFRPERRAAAPRKVGRTRLENVVLAALRVGASEAEARLRVLTDHPSMFDHALDHVPGMVAMEAARQLALAAAGDPRDTDGRLRVLALYGEFQRYIELDAGTDLRALVREEGHRTRVGVTFRQGSAVTCTVTVVLGEF